jgi:uncharacterized protein (UPF0332 family)
MKPEIRAYVRYRLSRAQETLEVARDAFSRGHLHESVSRLYYACFYVVSALLLTDGLRATKHRGIRSLFLQHWVKRGRLPAAMGRFFTHLFDNRQEADYSDLVVFQRAQVEAWITEAERFIGEISSQVEERLRLEELEAGNGERG